MKRINGMTRMFLWSLVLLLVFGIELRRASGDERPINPGITPDTIELLTYKSSEYRFKAIPLDTEPPEGFEQPDFDDSEFEPGTAPFGGGCCGLEEKDCPLRQTVQTEWPTETQLLVRRSVFIRDGATSVRIMVSVDNDVVGVFFNGKRVPDSSISHDNCPILDEFRIDVPPELVQPGQNLVAFHITDRRPIDGNETFFDVRILAEFKGDIINDRLSLIETKTKFSPIPVEDGPAGTFTITATFENVSVETLFALTFIVTKLTGGNLLLNADESPGGVGSTLTVPFTGDYSDGILAPGESFKVDFIIGLASKETFQFFVDALGVGIIPPIAGVPPGAGDFDEESFLQTPLLIKTNNVKQIDHPQSGFNGVPNEEMASSNTQSTHSLIAAASLGFKSVHPVAVTAFRDRIFVFGVASDGRVMFQNFGFKFIGVGGIWQSQWEARWKEVPGGLRTDTRVTVAATADKLFLFARNPESRALTVNVKSAGCAATECWSGWGAETLPEDFGASDFFVTSARDGRLFLLIDGPYQRPGGPRFREGMRIAVRDTMGMWGTFGSIRVPGEGVGTFDPLTASNAPTMAFDNDANAIRIYASMVRLREEFPFSVRLGLTRLSAPVSVLRGWQICRLNLNLPAGVEEIPVTATILNRAETLYFIGASRQVMALTFDATNECPSFSAATRIDASSVLTPDAPAAAVFHIAGRTAQTMVVVRDEANVVQSQLLTAMRLQALQVADDDGMFPANITSSQFDQWVQRANAEYTSGDIRFEFVPALDFKTRNDSALNRTDLCDVTVGSSTNCIVQKTANDVAALFPTKVLVIVRAGNTRDAMGNRVRTGGGFSWTDYDFVVMPGFPDTGVCGQQNIGLLAHELGHHLGLHHTFGGDPRNNNAPFGTATARTWLEENGNDVTKAFDADRHTEVLDTPGDPCVDFSGALGGPDEFCRDPMATVTITTKLGTATFTPPRRNTMSYYEPLDSSGNLIIQEITRDQADRMHANMPR